MKTAVEWLCEELSSKYGDDDFMMTYYDEIEQAAKMEFKQLECAWNSSDQNMRFQFSSSAYKALTFKQWFKNFNKNKL